MLLYMLFREGSGKGMFARDGLKLCLFSGKSQFYLSS